MRVIVALLLIGPLLWLSSPQSARPAPKPPRTAAPTAVKDWPRTVRGLGTDVEAAREDAHEQARRAIVRFLHKQQPPMQSWQPTRADIERYVQSGEAGPDITLEKLGVAKSWNLTLREPDLTELRVLDHASWLQAQEQARKLRTQERVVLLGKIMLGSLALLVLLVGGVRLSEKLQARYGRLVMAGVIGVAAFILVGLLLV